MAAALAFMGIVALLARATWFPAIGWVYARLPTVSTVVGIVCAAIGLLHARHIAQSGSIAVPRPGHLNLAGPTIDPLLEAAAFGAAFHTSASMLGRIFLDAAFQTIPLLERGTFALALGLLMFWSLKRPMIQFQATFLEDGVDFEPAVSPSSSTDDP